MLDEKIAKARKARKEVEEAARKLEEEAASQAKGQGEQESDESELTLEEVLKQISHGYLITPERQYAFEERSLLGGRLKLPVAKYFFEEVVNHETGFTFVRDLEGISLTGSLIPAASVDMPFETFQAGMKDQFKDMGLYLEWLDGGTWGPVSYGVYKVPTAKGTLYNMIFYTAQGTEIMIANMNCFEKQVKLWQMIMQATVVLAKVNWV